MRIEITHLADGRFSTCGLVPGIETGTDFYGRPCVFDDRAVAIRISAARMIRLCRTAVRKDWRWHGLHHAPEIIDWARQVVARETGGEKPKPIAFAMPRPPRQATGLPLFDLELANG
ncbi:hypothetical protein GXP64_20320 [Rhodovulum sulfidophilum]|nr:hypothetical protein [Rhodovulum sulfidophilum]